MTWEDLLVRPELWPRQCKVFRAHRYGDEVLTPDATYPLVGMVNEKVLIELRDGRSANIPHGDTDALAIANNTFAGMAPAQRALDTKAIAARADLWPAKVTLMKTVTTGEGDEKREYRKGSELTFGTFSGKWVTARHPHFDWTPTLELHDTDLVERIRPLLEAKRAPAGHRVLEDLDGKLVDLRTAKKARLSPKGPPEFVVLYFSAAWCGPCQRFSPQLVRFYEQHKKDAGKRFEVIWISRDHSEAEMRAYAKSHGFPWLAVAWDKLTTIPIAQAHDSFGIPDLVMLDAKSALIADSYIGGEYQGADSVLKVLAERLEKRQ